MTTSLALLFSLVAMASALVQALVRKGTLTSQEANEIVEVEDSSALSPTVPAQDFYFPLEIQQNALLAHPRVGGKFLPAGPRARSV